MTYDASAHEALVLHVEAMLFRHDPIGINFGGNIDEYRPEAQSIVPRLKHCHSVDDVREMVHEEFVHWFDWQMAGEKGKYQVIAQEVWAAWQSSSFYGQP